MFDFMDLFRPGNCGSVFVLFMVVVRKNNRVDLYTFSKSRRIFRFGVKIKSTHCCFVDLCMFLPDVFLIALRLLNFS